MAPAASTPSHVETESFDMLHLSPVQRKLLGQGGPIKVILKDKVVIGIQRDLFKAASSKASTLIDSKNPVHLSDACDEDSVNHIINWVNSTTVKNRIRELRLQRDPTKAMRFYHVAKELGMVKYIENTMHFHKSMIMKLIPNQEELATVEDLATGVDDRFVQMMASRIAYLVRHHELPEGYDYMGMVATFPKIDEAVHTTNASWEQRQAAKQEAKARRAERKRQYHARQARRNSHQHQYGQEQALNEREIADRRNNLLPKVNKKLISLTAEEREQALWFKNVRKDPAFFMAV
jgi:hypothetical protein